MWRVLTERLEIRAPRAADREPFVELFRETIVGYCGVAWFDFEGARRLEFGYRLVPGTRGRGYAADAGHAVLALASETFRGELLAMIDPANTASQNVIAKLGFEFWKSAEIDGFHDGLYRRTFS